MNDSSVKAIFKLVGIILLSIVGLYLIYALLFGSGFGINIGVRGGYGGGHMYMGAGAGYGAIGTVSLVLMFLVKVLFVLFIVGLVVGIAIAVKNHVFTEEDIRTLKGTFTGNRAAARETCGTCGKELNNEWKVCPFCGNEKTTTNT